MNALIVLMLVCIPAWGKGGHSRSGGHVGMGRWKLGRLGWGLCAIAGDAIWDSTWGV